MHTHGVLKSQKTII